MKFITCCVVAILCLAHVTAKVISRPYVDYSEFEYDYTTFEVTTYDPITAIKKLFTTENEKLERPTTKPVATSKPKLINPSTSNTKKVAATTIDEAQKETTFVTTRKTTTTPATKTTTEATKETASETTEYGSESTTFYDYTTDEDEFVFVAWSIWDEAWIWILIGCLIIIFLIFIPIIAMCCCGLCRCCCDRNKPEENKSLPEKRDSHENVPIYDTVPMDHADEEKKDTSDQEQEKSDDENKDNSSVDRVKSIIIEIDDPLKHRPLSALSPNKVEKKRTEKPRKSPNKARSFSGHKKSTYESKPQNNRANSVGSRPMGKTPTEVKLNIGNETIIKSSPFFRNNNKIIKPPSSNPNTEAPASRPVPKKRETLSPKKEHKKSRQRESDRAKRSKESGRHKKHGSHRDRNDRHDKNRNRKISNENESKQKQLLKAANSLENLIESISKFTKEYPIPESHLEPLKPVKNDEIRRSDDKQRKSRNPKSPRKESKDNQGRRSRPRQKQDHIKITKSPRARPRARDAERRGDDRTYEWAKRQQKIQKHERKEEKGERKRRDREAKPQQQKSAPKPVLMEHVDNTPKNKDTYDDEKRRRQLEKDLKKMSKYCNKKIPQDGEVENPAVEAT